MKVIVISGMDWDPRAMERAGLPVKGFLRKPSTSERLLRMLGELLREQEKETESYSES